MVRVQHAFTLRLSYFLVRDDSSAASVFSRREVSQVPQNVSKHFPPKTVPLVIHENGWRCPIPLMADPKSVDSCFAATTAGEEEMSGQRSTQGVGWGSPLVKTPAGQIRLYAAIAFTATNQRRSAVINSLNLFATVIMSGSLKPDVSIKSTALLFAELFDAAAVAAVASVAARPSLSCWLLTSPGAPSTPSAPGLP